ncbi:MAG TPA: hypothetical protein VEI50_16510 [Nitrospiraceae bacterium]|nr:hypothetical protein [Nitrospiraceae bacterium]
MTAQWMTLTALLALLALCGVAPPEVNAQPMDDPGATTELSCSFGMAKGESGQTCQVPFPQGCLVAHIPGTNKPWTTISKGGATRCKFDEKATDWKTRITGVCGRCTSPQCSAQFHVRFNCSGR